MPPRPTRAQRSVSTAGDGGCGLGVEWDPEWTENLEQLSLTDCNLATGRWVVDRIPRSGSLAAGGTTLGLIIYSNSISGQSPFEADMDFGKLCLQQFKRSAPACAPLVIAHPTWMPSLGACTTPSPPNDGIDVNCNGGALGIRVGDHLNAQFWLRDPQQPFGANESRLSSAMYSQVF
jgi:hypothetical protein